MKKFTLQLYCAKRNLLFALFFFSTLVASSQTFYVNDNSTVGDVYTSAVGNNSNPGTASAPFATIQAAIAAATSGDVINVDAGTYAELININKAITLNGPNATVPGTGSRSAEAILQFPPSFANGSSLIKINSNLHGVTIAGFDLRCQDATVPNSLYLITAVASSSSDATEKWNNMTIKNNRFYSSEIPLYILEDFVAHGSGLLIEGNYINGGPNVNNLYNRGFYVGGTSGTIQDNTVENCSIAIQYMPYSNPNAGLIRRNTVTASSVGLYHNFQTKGAASVTWEQNVVSAAPNPQTGLSTQVDGAGTTPTIFRGIHVKTFGTQGTGANPSVNFQNNSINAANPGGTTSTVFRAVFLSATSAGDVTLSNNSFTNYTEGNVRNTDATATTITATCNWWGSAVTATVNAAASSATTSSPWLSSGTDTDAAIGFQPASGSCGIPFVTPTATVTGLSTVCAGTGTTLTLVNAVGTIAWQKSTNWTAATPTWTGATGTTTSLATRNLSVSTAYRAVVTSGTSTSAATTPNFVVTVTPIAVAGTITTNSASVCLGGSVTYTLSGSVGSAIQWQSLSSATDTSVTVVGTGASYTATNVSGTILYVRAVVTSGICPTATTAVKTLTVNPTSVGGTITGGGVICSGASGLLKVRGYTGSVLLWEYSTDGVNYVAVPTLVGTAAATFRSNTISNTTASYSFTNITGTTYFRFKSKNGVCDAAYSNVVQYSIIPTATAGTVTGLSTQVCVGTGTTLTLENSNGTIAWQKSTNWTATTPTWTAATGTTTSFATRNLSVSTAFRAVVTSGTCSTSAATTPNFVVTITPTATAGTVTGLSTVCAGTGTTLTLENSNGTTIAWQKSTNWTATTPTWTGASGTTTSLATRNLSASTAYRAVVTSGTCVTSAATTTNFIVNVSSCTAKSELAENPFAVVAYPNPFSDNFKLDFTSSSEDKVSILVYDMIGKLLEKREVQSSEMNAVEIGNSYPSGVYNVIVTQGENIKTLRVIRR